MCYKYTLKMMKNGTKMVRLDIMSRHDREKIRKKMFMSGKNVNDLI